MYHICTTVPTPTVNITISNDQIAGQPLTLYCNVIAVRGITSTVNITWLVDDGELETETVVDVSSPMDGMQLYMHSYTIDELSVADTGKVYQCEVLIDSDQPVDATSNFMLNVNSK